MRLLSLKHDLQYPIQIHPEITGRMDRNTKATEPVNRSVTRENSQPCGVMFQSDSELSHHCDTIQIRRKILTGHAGRASKWIIAVDETVWRYALHIPQYQQQSTVVAQQMSLVP